MVKVQIYYRDHNIPKEEIECTYCKPQLGFFEIGTRMNNKEGKGQLSQSRFIPSDLIEEVISVSKYDPANKRKYEED